MCISVIQRPSITPLVKRLHGQVVKLSPTSKNYVNPLDINLNYSEDENPLALKSDFVLSFCELVMGGKNGLEAIEKTVIDRAVQVIYRPYLADPQAGKYAHPCRPAQSPVRPAYPGGRPGGAGP